MVIGLEIVLDLIQILILFVMYSRISGNHLSRYQYILAIIVYYVSGFIIVFFFYSSILSLVSYLFMPLFFLIFSLVISKNVSKYLSIFYGLFPIVLWNLLHRSITFFILPGLGFSNIQQISHNKTLLTISALTASILSFVIPNVLQYNFEILNKQQNPREDRKIIIFLNISMLIYYLLVQIFSYLEVMYRIDALLYRELVVVIYIIIFLISLNILDRNLRERIQQQLSEQRELQLRNMSDYSQHIEELYNELRSFRHDYINILRSLKLGIDTHDLPAIEQIYNQVLKDSGQALNQSKYDLGRLSNIHNDALKSVLSAKFLEAQSKGIEIGLEVPQEIKPQGMELLDFITIVSILADNAIEAAVETSHPVVSFAFLEQEGRQIFIVENTIKEFSIHSDNIFKKGFSTKGENRGLGLSNVQNIISHYPNVSLRTTSHDHSFRQELEIK
ncbi:sensor histidine kinase [Streptococcus cristatus]|uniref:sensor histidine kinase n=1 Tax=Streptococcus cristatus TaxID=45634 RepID=UPI0005EEA771|nr:GHKL domain-containing protein [Streptococcus cristatus]KJQ60332.1 histidine kinase [Streptococcus cristatus]QIP49562.1 GHKL domain-containing protein [Streptococcus cristatus ATCC 51100]